MAHVVRINDRALFTPDRFIGRIRPRRRLGKEARWRSVFRLTSGGGTKNVRRVRDIRSRYIIIVVQVCAARFTFFFFFFQPTSYGFQTGVRYALDGKQRTIVTFAAGHRTFRLISSKARGFRNTWAPTAYPSRYRSRAVPRGSPNIHGRERIFYAHFS
jgi:hypothetical protein